MTAKQSNLKLPQKLLDQIGGEDILYNGRKSRSQPRTRKELRKAERNQKRSLRAGPPPTKKPKLYHTSSLEAGPREPVSSHIDSSLTTRENPLPKSILKRRRHSPKPSKIEPSLSISPPEPISKNIRNKLAEEDEEIAALEKKLGLKSSKKLPQAFKDDGLDDLLDGLYDEEDSEIVQKKRSKAEEDEWLNQKRRRAAKSAFKTSATSKSELMSDDQINNSYSDTPSNSISSKRHILDDILMDKDASEANGFDTPDGFNGFSSDEDGPLGSSIIDKLPPKHRENPYVAPSTGSSSGKYIPPSLRKLASSDSNELIRLRRRTQGLINRLTESNLISILGDIEVLYRDNPRQHVTMSLVDILLTSVCEPTSLPDTLIILPAGFIAATYKVIGTDFGAQIVQKIVESFDLHYSRSLALAQHGPEGASVDSSKETSNLIMLLAELYNFHVIGSNLMFDYIRLFLGQLSELNAELLLKIIRASGPQLRQDDPSSLKDIVALLHPAIAKVGENNLSVRTKFMIEMINDLKINKMKAGEVASAVRSQHTTQMKKIIGALNNRTIKASEPLRIGLKDIRDSDKKGKWWLVGASWAGNNGEEKKPVTNMTKSTTVRNDGTSDLVQLAKEQRMNTDVRRAIFITILSATDYQDAYLRLMKLKLKKAQEYEIPKVLIHCARVEKSYNPYYTLIAKRICGDRKLKMAFQFCLWDFFRQMGENEEDGLREEDEEALETRHLVNLAKLFGTLISDGSLSLAVFKYLNMRYIQPKTKTFLEVLFITVLLESQRASKIRPNSQAIVNIFSKARDIPQLIEGLQYFLKKTVGKTDIAGGKEEKDTVKWTCKVAQDTLQELAV